MTPCHKGKNAATNEYKIDKGSYQSVLVTELAMGQKCFVKKYQKTRCLGVTVVVAAMRRQGSRHGRTEGTKRPVQGCWESRHGVRGVVGRVVKVCVEWPAESSAESSGESSRCAWSGRQSRHGVAERVVAAGRCMGRRLLDRGIELRLMVQLSISSWNGAVVRFPSDSEEGHPIKC